MPASRRQKLGDLQARVVSVASQISNASHQTTVSDFLEAKITELEAEKDYIRCIKDGLLEAQEQGSLASIELEEQLGPLLHEFRSQADIVRAMKRDQRTLVEDLQDKVDSKRLQSTDPEEDDGLLERAYRDAIMERVMSAVARQAKSKFDHGKFKRRVNRYYGFKQPAFPKSFSWCHVLGFPTPASIAKVAHIVPKSLSSEEIAHIFGQEDDVITDARGALLLYAPIELLLDTGAIAIVPVPQGTSPIAQWKCVVLDESQNDEIAWYCGDGTSILVKDLDERELRFLNDNRPRRRYLYFRFLISYLNAKRLGKTSAVRNIEQRRFWPSDGAYLHRSTLVALARCISGSEIPPSLLHNMTFEGSSSALRDEEIGMMAGAAIREETNRNLREAVVSTMWED
ncbi:hypothetical protein N7481_007576 [Penicillium waksmanii]|uniref:uncharacterized protein n=1 Tax=Penicillium waksmanii TaxID=69791 RepID=UPI002547A697|nr:uncharacterized protein N7481_007576 [Penicillium waksmanii]KAJ5980278.1 hypothetical protein N7481_007576 [Penicillium waksmanii]